MSINVYTKAEVATHDQKSNGWFIIHDDVYDVSKFYDDHPGGRDVLLHLIGQDATEAFVNNNHSKGAYKLLQTLKIGTLCEKERRKYFTMNEVQEHNAAKSAWFVIHNKVYDVTPFLDLHPGGRDILLYNSGNDATMPFENNHHSRAAYEMMKPYCIGELHPSECKSTSRHTNGSRSVNEANSNSNAEAYVRDGIQVQLKGNHSVSSSQAGFTNDDSNNKQAFQNDSASRKHNEDESLMGRIQAQLKIFIFLAFFVMAAAYLLS